MKRTVLILIVVIGAIGYIIFSRPGTKLSYDPHIASAFVRIAVINQIYQNNPDSCGTIRAMILKEEGLSEADFKEYESYLKSNPGYFGEFLDSLEALTDSLSALPAVTMQYRIFPRELLPKSSTAP